MNRPNQPIWPDSVLFGLIHKITYFCPIHLNQYYQVGWIEHKLEVEIRKQDSRISYLPRWSFNSFQIFFICLLDISLIFNSLYTNVFLVFGKSVLEVTFFVSFLSCSCLCFNFWMEEGVECGLGPRERGWVGVAACYSFWIPVALGR